MNKTRLFSVLLGILLAATLFSRAQTTAQTNNSPAASSASAASISDQMMELMRAVDAAKRAVSKADSTNEDKLWNEYVSLNATTIPKLMDLATQDAASPAAFISCEWVVTNRQVQEDVPRLFACGLQAVELLRDHGGATNPTIAPVCWAIGRNWRWWRKSGTEFLQEVRAKNPDRDARGNAIFALASLKKDESEALEWLQIAPDYLSEEWRKSTVEEAKTTDPQTVRIEAERLFESVIQSYSNCPVPVKRESMLGERATAELYELQHLQVGQVAPEINGEDLDGQKLKLSDYRGKIVFLSFWGSWCGPCMAAIPHERKLAESMIGKPFAIVGVDSDKDRLDGKRAVQKKQITWPSFWCGTNGWDGPIPTKWNVKGWPTVYVMDPKGTIRLKMEGFGSADTVNLVNQTIDRLLKEQ
jgi:thiol-disulfide isomerase/thioredoxin